jgi:4-amino-4-deoxy-L-arabinose transferase-like glycosyltransferase
LLRAVVALVVLRAMPIVSDAHDYFDAAMRLASGDFQGAFYWPPGEPLLLACAMIVLGKSVVTARLVTIATSVGTVAIVALIARELAGERAARIAAWIAALYPPSVLLCGQTYAQHLAAFCVAAVAYCGLRGLRERRPVLFAISGCALGLGCITRPSMVSLVPVVAAAWAITAHHDSTSRRPLVLGAALATCSALAFVLPAQAHDARAGAGWTISTNNERNLFLGNNPYTPDYKTSHLGQRSLDELPPDARAYLESFYGRSDAREAMQREAISYILRHPLRTALRTLNRATSFWGFDYIATREIQNWGGWGFRAVLPLLALEAGSYVAIAALAIVAMLALRSACRSDWRGWLIALMVAYEVPYAIAFSGGTYHFPVMTLVVPFAAVTVTQGLEAYGQARVSRATIALLAMFAIVEVQYAYFALAMKA